MQILSWLVYENYKTKGLDIINGKFIDEWSL